MELYRPDWSRLSLAAAREPARPHPTRAPPRALLSRGASPLSTPRPQAREVVIAGHAVRCLRLTFVGELGFELHITSPACVHLAVTRRG